MTVEEPVSLTLADKLEILKTIKSLDVSDTSAEAKALITEIKTAIKNRDLDKTEIASIKAQLKTIAAEVKADVATVTESASLLDVGQPVSLTLADKLEILKTIKNLDVSDTSAEAKALITEIKTAIKNRDLDKTEIASIKAQLKTIAAEVKTDVATVTASASLVQIEEPLSMAVNTTAIQEKA